MYTLVMLAIFLVIIAGFSIMQVYDAIEWTKKTNKFIETLSINLVCFFCGITLGTYYYKSIEPTAKDLMRGKVKVEVIETKVNGKVIDRDTTYTYKDENYR